MNEKTVGYALLFSGIVVMFIAVLYVFLTFTGVMSPLPIFNGVGDLSNMIGTGSLQNPYAISPNQPGTISPQANLLDPSILSEVLNLTTTIFLMGFLMSFGYKMSSLGTQLVRPINVKMKTADVEAKTASETPKIEAK